LSILMSLEYLIILFIIFIVTFILEIANHIHLYCNRRERLEIIGLFLLVGVIWDTFAIWRGHWIFPAGKTLGIKIGLMPLEEYFFILIIPYFILTVYKLIDSKLKRRK
jgi:lycopene cyclase domain-containing protein